MKEPHKFVLVSIVSGVLSGIVVAMVLSYFAENPTAADHPVSVRNTKNEVAAVGVESSYSSTPANQPINHASTPANQPVIRSNTLVKAERAQLRENQVQLQHLEQRLKHLASTLNSNHGATADYEATALEREEVTPEEARAANLKWWEETKMQFEREEVDTKWAETTNQLFESDLAGLIEGSGFSMVYTECRSTQCAAVLEWTSYSEAIQGYAELLHHPYQANCARHTLLPAPSEKDADQPYQMTIIFDCSESG
jgi:hypothetical protein